MCVCVCLLSNAHSMRADRSPSNGANAHTRNSWAVFFVVVCLVAHFAAGRTVRLGYRVGSVRCVLDTRTHIHVSLIAAVFCLFVVALGVRRRRTCHCFLTRGGRSAHAFPECVQFSGGCVYVCVYVSYLFDGWVWRGGGGYVDCRCSYIGGDMSKGI